MYDYIICYLYKEVTEFQVNRTKIKKTNQQKNFQLL